MRTNTHLQQANIFLKAHGSENLLFELVFVANFSFSLQWDECIKSRVRDEKKPKLN